MSRSCQMSRTPTTRGDRIRRVMRRCTATAVAPTREASVAGNPPGEVSWTASWDSFPPALATVDDASVQASKTTSRSRGRLDEMTDREGNAAAGTCE